MFVDMQYRLRTVASALRPQLAAGLLVAGALVAPVLIVARPAESGVAPAPSWASYAHVATGAASYARCVSTDPNGNVYVSGTSGGDYLTVKYGPTGQSLWTARYDGPAHGADVPSAIAVDDSGNVYVTGSSYGGDPLRGGTDYDVATVKYSPQGQQVWAARYNGPANGEDAATALAVGTGGVYVTGYAASDSGADYLTIRYAQDGTPIWTDRLDGAGGADHATAIAIDGEGDVYVTGESWRGAANFDYLTVKYNWAGGLEWAQTYNGPGNGADSATALAVNRAEEVFVTGVSDGGNPAHGGTGLDFATIKYSSVGTPQWFARYDSGAHGPDGAVAIALGPDEDPVVTGRSFKSNTGFDYATVAYDDNGLPRWTARYDGPASGNDRPAALAVDEGGNTYVTGEATAAGRLTVYATVKYTQAGDLDWAATFAGAASGPASGVCLALRSPDSLVVSGAAWGTNLAPDFGTVVYPRSVPVPPVAPTNLQATFTSGTVSLSWQEASAGVTTFKVQRKSGTGSFSQIGTTNGSVLTYADSAVSPGQTYTYQVIASGVAGDSPASATATVLVPGGSPGKIQIAPAKVNFGTVKVGTSRAKVVKVKNAGKGTLLVTVPAPSAPFSGTAATFVLLPKKTQSVTLTFAPAAAGAATGTLLVQSTDPARPSLTLSLTGKGK